jgi:hypothetical protein
LTVEEFQQILPVFDEMFCERMKYSRLDGKLRVGREYRTYVNCPLPTPEDRLLFILVYMKNNPLQVLQGELFGMPQNKANQWIHTLLPVLQLTMRKLGDTPARSVLELAKLIDQRVLTDESSSSPDACCNEHDMSVSSSDVCGEGIEQMKPANESPPLFAMMGQKDVSSALKTKMNRKTIIVERRSVIQ